MLILFSVFLLSSVSNSQSQMFGEYELKSTSEGCLILFKQSIGLDTLCLSSGKGLFKRNEILEAVHGKIIKIEFIVGGTDLNNLYYSIEEWHIKNDKFLHLNSAKIPLKGCQVKRLKFSLTKNGISWSYRRGFLKKRKWFYTF